MAGYDPNDLSVDDLSDLYGVCNGSNGKWLVCRAHKEKKWVCRLMAPIKPRGLPFFSLLFADPQHCVQQYTPGTSMRFRPGWRGFTSAVL